MDKNFSLVAADIGGTKTTLALYTPDSGLDKPVLKQTYKNRQAHGFEEILEEFLAQTHIVPDYASIGIAGIVLGDSVHMTNLDWKVSKKDLTSFFNFKKVFLINDLVATGMGAVRLGPDDLITLNSGTPAPEAAVSVLAPGTGLGQAFIIKDEHRFIPLPSEGGHVSFAPRTLTQLELLSFMMTRHEHVSVEHVCSGSGLPDLFSFMASRFTPADSLEKSVAVQNDPTPVIVHTAIESLQLGKKKCPAYQALKLFCEILADEAANLVLKTMSFGGIYIGGGLTLRILPFLEAESFMGTFSRGRYKNRLQNIPVKIITKPDTALMGAAAYGFNKLEIS